MLPGFNENYLAYPALLPASLNSIFPQANAAYAKMGKADKKTSDMAFDTLFGGSSEKVDEN